MTINAMLILMLIFGIGLGTAGTVIYIYYFMPKEKSN